MPPVITIGALPFTHSKLTVERTLKAFEDYLGWLVRLDWSKHGDMARYTPDWRKRHNRMQDREPQDTPGDRDQWFRQILGTAMAYGMDLATTGEPDPVEVVWAVARWAHGALLHIQDLEGQVRRLTGEQIAADMKWQREYETLLKCSLDQRSEIDRTKETLRAAGEREADMAAKLAELQRQMREAGEERQRSERRLKDEIDGLVSEVKRADSERDAWKAAAQSANSALDTLRAALRIPSGPAEVVGGAVGETALVRR